MIKTGTYHIIWPNARLRSERVRCHIEGNGHRHRYHTEETFQAICGATTPRNSCCNSTIANPNWTYDWCHDCVKALPWTEQAKKIWLEKHGIDTYANDAELNTLPDRE